MLKETVLLSANLNSVRLLRSSIEAHLLILAIRQDFVLFVENEEIKTSPVETFLSNNS